MRMSLIAAGLAVALAGPTHAATLKVCTVDWPPYTVSQGREVGGTHTELVTAMFRRMHQDVQIDQIAWERCLKEIESGGYDAAYSASFKPERAEYALYPKVPLQTVSYVMVVAKGTGGGWDAGKDVAKLAQPVAAPRGFSITADLQKLPGVTVDDGAATDLQDMQKLAAGRLRSVAIEASVARALIERLKLADQVEVLTPAFVTGKDYFIIVSKRHGGSPAAAEQLTNSISETLAAMRDSGELNEIAARH